MSYVTLEEVKAALVIDVDDARIQMAIDDAEDEALRFLDMDGVTLAEALQEDISGSEVESDADNSGNQRSVRRAVILLVQTYIDPMTPMQNEYNRKAAQALLFPYRERLGG